MKIIIVNSSKKKNNNTIAQSIKQQKRCSLKEYGKVTNVVACKMIFNATMRSGIKFYDNVCGFSIGVSGFIGNVNVFLKFRM